ncbi:unnamed protein product [Arctogadus glacialis]
MNTEGTVKTPGALKTFWNILWFIRALSAAMRGCVLLLALMLVVRHGLCKDQGQTSIDSINIRKPEIDPYWYTGRGIRPVGRFGRRVKARGPHLARTPPLPPCTLRRSPSASCTHHWLLQ